ncbi:hypothetical protein ACTFIY_000240 [Dictyostelium cf. discoideum]
MEETDKSLLTGGNVVIDRIVLNTGAIRRKKQNGDHFVELQLIIYAHHRAIENYNKTTNKPVTFEKGVESLLEIGKYYDYVYDLEKLGFPYHRTNTEKSSITAGIIRILEDENNTERKNQLYKDICTRWRLGFIYLINYYIRGKRAKYRMTKTDSEFIKKFGEKKSFEVNTNLNPHPTVKDYLEYKYEKWLGAFFYIIKRFFQIVKEMRDQAIKDKIFRRCPKEKVKKINDMDNNHHTEIQKI